MLRSLWQLLKGELSVAAKTFFVTWLLLSLALLLYGVFDSPNLHGAKDVALLLTVGLLICAFHTFWPALGLAMVRATYRIVGWGAFVGAFSIGVGTLILLILFRNVIASLVIEVFDLASFSGPCGAHAGGAVVALSCVVLAIVASPASWWPLLKLFLVVSGAILLGSVPGVMFWLVLLVRKTINRRGARANDGGISPPT